jgi:hypothetical protein
VEFLIASTMLVFAFMVGVVHPVYMEKMLKK